MAEEKEEITSEKISRSKTDHGVPVEVTELLIEKGEQARQVGFVEIGYRGKAMRYNPSEPYQPQQTQADGHTAERHKALNTPPIAPEAPTPDG